MNPTRSDHPDAARSHLRGLVATIDRQIHETTPPAGGLLAAWTDLVAALALGPEPDVRECPSCHHLCIRTASICSGCWTKLAPWTADETPPAP